MNQITTNLSYDEYSKLNGINWSVLKHMDEPAVARHQMLSTERAQTDSMKLGSLVDCMITTPKLTECLFAKQPEGDEFRFTTKVGKQWKQDQLEKGLTPISIKMWGEASAMRDSVMAHPEAEELLGFGMSQAAIEWEEKHGIQCRGLLDFITAGKGFVELKTTSADSWDKFSRDCYFRKYYGQLAFYQRGLQACGREASDVRMIVVRSHPPYVSEIFKVGYMMLDEGNRLVDNMLDTWNVWKDREGDWKETSHETPVLDMPMWAYGN